MGWGARVLEARIKRVIAQLWSPWDLPNVYNFSAVLFFVNPKTASQMFSTIWCLNGIELVRVFLRTLGIART